MRGLFGDFETLPLAELVRVLGEGRSTGILQLENGLVRKQVSVDEGDVVSVSSDDPRDYLGQFLINQGVITEEQFRKAFETQKQTKMFLGRVLVMFGTVSEEGVRSAMSLKMRETFLEAFRWAQGTFAFQPEPEQEEMEGLHLRMPLLDIGREAGVRDEAWTAIRGVFPHGGCILEFREEYLPTPPLPNSLDARLISLMEAACTIDEMALTLHAPDFFIYQRLFALQRLGAVSVLSDVAPPPRPLPHELPGDDLPADAEPEQMLERAQVYEAQGRFAEAMALARRASRLESTPAVLQFIADTESSWLEYLRGEYLGGSQRWILAVSPPQLKVLPLSAPERYLLARFETPKDVASVILVSPLRELDVLSTLEALLKRKLLLPAQE